MCNLQVTIMENKNELIRLDIQSNIDKFILNRLRNLRVPDEKLLQTSTYE